MVRIIRRQDDGTVHVTDTKTKPTSDIGEVATRHAIAREVLRQQTVLPAKNNKINKTPIIIAAALLATALAIGVGTLFLGEKEPESASQPELTEETIIASVDDVQTGVEVIEQGQPLRPRIRPEFVEKSMVIPYDALSFHEIDTSAGYQAHGCGAQRGFDEFWIGGLDQTPFFKIFVDDYKSRLRLGDKINDDSLPQHRYMLQIMLGMNECYETVNSSTYDRNLGPASQAAVMAFQAENDLPQTGEADAQTLDLLVHASAMRVMFNMHVLDTKAREFDLDPLGVFQKAWHESFYSHMAVSATGADGVGQFVEATFLDELRRMKHPLYSEYERIREEEGDLSNVRATMRDMQYDVWTNAHLMMRYCDRLLDRFNETSCADVYGAYQLGETGYRKLIDAAAKNPDHRASDITRGTTSNGYGHMRAEDALSYVRSLIQNDNDHARAVRDLRFLENMRLQRSHILGPQAPNQNSMAMNIKYTIDG